MAALFNTMDLSFQQHADEWVDFDAFINFDGNILDDSQDHQAGLVDLFPQDQSLSTQCFDLNNKRTCGHIESFPQETSAAIRDRVYARATVDTRSASMKEKRRDAAIALHMQRLNEKYLQEAHFSPGDNFYPGSVSPESSQDSLPELSRTVSSYSSSTPASGFSSEQAPQTPSGGVEMVLDLNMNAATRLPKKQKPRTKAQMESYINARKNGVCEKHRKQHKRCNCLGEIATNVTPDARVRKPVRRSSIPQEQTAYVRQGELSSVYGRLAPSISRVPSPRYVCLMPSCTYSSSTVPSLQQHYARHSVISRVNTPADEHSSPRYLRIAASPILQERTSAYARGNLASSALARRPTLARATPLPSVHQASGTLAIKRPKEYPGGLVKDFRKTIFKSSSSSLPLDYSLQSVLEHQKAFTSMISALVLRQIFLVTICGLLRFLQFSAAVDSCLQTYCNIAATVHGYNRLITGGMRIASAEELITSWSNNIFHKNIVSRQYSQI